MPQIARAGKDRLLAFHVCDWLVPTRDILNDRGMMGDGVIDIMNEVPLTLAISRYDHVEDLTGARRARRHPADMPQPADRGNLLPLSEIPRMGRIRTVLREIRLAHFSGRHAP
jgi:hypothetical protein